VYLDDSSNKLYISDGTGVGYPIDSIEHMEGMDEYRRKKELAEAEHKERLEALRTIFPRGHDTIENFEIIVDFARNTLTNPLYEGVLKDFEDAQTALHRAARKLASTVKLADSEEIDNIARAKNAQIWWQNVGSTTLHTGTSAQANLSRRHTVYNPPVSTSNASLAGSPKITSAGSPPPVPVYSSSSWTGATDEPKEAKTTESLVERLKATFGLKKTDK
jgi:hypothetical protein